MTGPSAHTLHNPSRDAAPDGPGTEPAAPRTARFLHRLALAGSATVIIAVVAYDAVTITSNHRSRTALQTTVGLVERTQSTLSATTSQVASTTTTRDARRRARSRAVDEIGTTRQSLSTAAQTDHFQTLDIATLQACLAGVSSAVTAIASTDLQGAVNSITAASSACESLDSSSGGLAYPFDLPDPFVLTVGSEYYGFATNSSAGNIQINQSSDLTHWTTFGDALPHQAAWAQPGATWAPSVLQRGGSLVLCYSALDGETGEQCIPEAVATQPHGPYLDTSQSPLECQPDLGGSLDPSAYVATDGTPYLTWNSQGANGQPPTLWSQQLTPDGTALVAGSPSTLLTPSQSWQGGMVEGPDMVVSGGQYLLFYSANNCQTADYAIGVADCSGPLGPCTESSNQPLLASQQAISGPGGPSVFTDTLGNPWMAIHAWLPGRVGYPNSRPLFLRRITISGGVAQVGL